MGNSKSKTLAENLLSYKPTNNQTAVFVLGLKGRHWAVFILFQESVQVVDLMSYYPIQLVIDQMGEDVKQPVLIKEVAKAQLVLRCKWRIRHFQDLKKPGSYTDFYFVGKLSYEQGLLLAKIKDWNQKWWKLHNANDGYGPTYDRHVQNCQSATVKFLSEFGFECPIKKTSLGIVGPIVQLYDICSDPGPDNLKIIQAFLEHLKKKKQQKKTIQTQ